MPSPQALSVAEQHRQQQAQQLGLIAALVAAYFIRAMGNGENIQGATPGWVALLLPRLERERQESARRATRYFTLARALETAPGPSLPSLPSTSPTRPSPALEVAEAPAPSLVLPREAVTTSLAVTGPVALRRSLRRGEPFETAVRKAASGAAGAAVRHVGNGGREALSQLVREETRAFGWVRHTRARPCWFCAMLASRGPVYKDDSFDESDPRFEDGDVSSNVKVHDRCQCFLVPLFDRGSEMPGPVNEFAELWAESTKGTFGSKMRKAFRDAYAERYGAA